MSLFKVRELWETHCGSDESFDHKSITIAKIGGISEKIIVGSHNGFLRIIAPSNKRSEEGTAIGYRPTDLLLEVQLKHPILQVSCGKLVSGSQNTQLCVLHPRSVAVYNYSTQPGATEHGDQNHLVLAYEHNLRRSAFSMILGPFGGVSNRDFICVQSLDGALCFFEQETFTFMRFLPSFLLPGPIEFLPHTDAFVTVSSSWHVECYRYQALAESGASDQEVSSGRKLIADWTYNLGEGALDMKCISWPSHSDVVILGEKNLYCLRDSGTLKFMKRLEYRPCCFHCYIVEPDGKLMILIITDTNMLMVYEQTTLRWSAKLLISPVHVTRVSIEELNGVIAVMSDSGHLQCCFLGTEPSLFMPPPLEVTALDYEESRKELFHLQKIIRAYSKENSNSLANTAAEKELVVTVNVSNQIEPGAYPTRLLDPLSDMDHDAIPMCRVAVELVPHAPLSKVQVAFVVSPPLGVSQVSHSISSLCETTQIAVFIYLFEPGDVSNLKLRVVTSYVANARGVPRILQNVATLPLKLVVSTCPATKEGEHKITINTTHPAVGLAQLFPEFIGEGSMSGASSSIGFIRWGTDSSVVSTFAAKTSQRYRVQSDSFPAMCLLAHQLLERLEKHFSKSKDFACSFSSSPPIQALFVAVDSHFTSKRESYKLQEQLNQRATQYRVIQRRLLVKFKDKTPAPISNLDVLLKNTHQMIKESSEALEENQQDLARARCQLECSVHLLVLLLKLSPAKSHPHFDDLIAAFNNPVNDSEDQGWEEATNVAISYMLRTCLARTVKEQQKSTPLTLDLLKDTSRLKKHIAAAIERVSKGVKSQEKGHSDYIKETISSTSDKKEANSSSNMGISTIPEEASVPEVPCEEETVLPAGSQFAENRKSAPVRGRSANILKARRLQQEADRAENNKENTLEETSKESVIDRTVSALERDKRFNELAATIESPPEIFPGGDDDDDMW